MVKTLSYENIRRPIRSRGQHNEQLIQTIGWFRGKSVTDSDVFNF